MAESSQTVRQCEGQIEQALWSLEVNGKVKEALAVYRAAEATLQALEVADDQPVCAEQQRVLAYCLMRQGNALRQLGQSQEALTVSEREVAAARAPPRQSGQSSPGCAGRYRSRRRGWPRSRGG